MIKNIIVFSSSELGGAERSLTRMALASPDGMYQLATLDGEGPWSDWVRRQDRKPLIFGIRGAAQHGRSGPRAFLALVRHVRNSDLQVVYICGIRASLWLRLLKPLMPGVKMVQAIRTNPDSNSSLDRFIRIVERWLNGLIDLYISNSQIAATTLVERCSVPADKIKVIHNGVGAKPINTRPISERPLNVLTVANLIPYKGHLEFLSAIKKVLQEIPDVNFIFIGRDDMNGKVQSAIIEWDLSEHVTYVGFQEDVSSWMKDARLLVLPSLKEGAPTTVLEAMSYGLPVVAYNLGGLPELIRHEQDGLLVPAKDTKCLAMGIIKLLRDKELANKMSISSLGRSETDFQLNTCAMKHRDALLLLIKGS